MEINSQHSGSASGQHHQGGSAHKPMSPLRAIRPSEMEDELDDGHGSANLDTPLREDAFAMSDADKIAAIATHFEGIMQTLGLDLTDDSLKGTPLRVAKMYVNEAFKGLNPKYKPAPTLFENRYQYSQMLVERDIRVYSNCEHHFVPIVGRAHVAYFAEGKVVGLSKLNRIVDYYSRRPQVQERLTRQVAEELKDMLQTPHVAVLIEADHMCVASRGIQDTSSRTLTADYHGRFLDDAPTRAEFLRMIGK